MLQHPRFVDPDKCTGCGECARVCPVALKNEYDMGLSERRAIYRRYAQAVPGAFAIEKRGTSPCKVACPAHISVQGYLALAAAGRFQEALKLIKQENPLPAVCGRVCHHPCEAACTRGEVDEPVAIDAVKRFIADLDLRSETRYLPEIKTRRQEKVAVIGSGPAGLACAYYLALEGYQVTVFEKLPVLGGMLTVGIPAYRLPRDVIEAEIQVIRDMGVAFQTGVTIGVDITLSDLRSEGYRAFFIAVGAHECRPLGIEGEDLEGVLPGVRFLRDVNLGIRVALGDRVAVVGGGNVAMDAVRTALRNGSAKPFILYRRSLEEMPANAEEIEECREEGIEILTLVNPVRILGENGRVKAVECVRMSLGEPEAGGRRRPIPVPGSECVIEVDAVIPAIGQETDWACLTPECACRLSPWGTLNVDPLTLQSDDPEIFAGGDAVTGPRSVIEAIAAGKQAAISMDRFLRGVDLREGREREWRAVEGVRTEGWDRIPRERMPRLEPEKRKAGYREVQRGFTEEQARKEASRCLACGVCSECGQCVDACLAGAIRHDDEPRVRELRVGAVILAPGFQPFDPTGYDTYAHARLPNVVTSMAFERFLSASGPTQGHLLRPSDGKEPRKIAWLQCVGSRDIHHGGHGYCSGVCCMYAVKEAVIAKEHAGGELDTAIFFMDLRTHGKDFDQYAQEARDRHGVRFIRSRVHTIEEVPGTGGDLEIVYVTEDGAIRSERFDLAVLSVGIEVPDDVAATAERLGVALDPDRFALTNPFAPVETSRPGVYACGAFSGPKDIPVSVMEASAAACAATASLAGSRHTQTRALEHPQEREVSRERPRIGVFVCNCGINIGGVVNVPEVVRYAGSLPNVVLAEENLFTCSQDTQDRMTRVIRDQRLNRVVIAACSPRTHESLFQETLIQAGLNKYLLEMANIRNLDSWVHGDDPKAATAKAKDLVRMAAAKVRLLAPLREARIPVTRAALVVGGGVAGMTAALSLARHGFPVHLVERTERLGGNARRLHKTWNGEAVQPFVEALVAQVEAAPNVAVHLSATLEAAEGFVGNFKSRIREDGSELTVEHGVAVIATGAAEHRPKAYLYGEHPAVVTGLELDELFEADDPRLMRAQAVAFIQCVGSRDADRPYCSKVCCTHTVRSALELKARNPEADVFALYRDMRTYGRREELFREARSQGVLFFRYGAEEKPEVRGTGDRLRLQFRDPILGRPIAMEVDLLCLATAVTSHRDQELSRLFKIPLDGDGWFLEAHQKLRPVDFASDGVFLCGMAHYPKSLEESIAQAQAAASRALTVLTRAEITVGGVVSRIDPDRCSGCGTCAEVCPYGAIVMNEEKKTAEVVEALCKGCGACAAACPAEAPALAGFSHTQLYAQIRSALAA